MSYSHTRIITQNEYSVKSLNWDGFIITYQTVLLKGINKLLPTSVTSVKEHGWSGVAHMHYFVLGVDSLFWLTRGKSVHTEPSFWQRARMHIQIFEEGRKYARDWHRDLCACAGFVCVCVCVDRKLQGRRSSTWKIH